MDSLHLPNVRIYHTCFVISPPLNESASLLKSLIKTYVCYAQIKWICPTAPSRPVTSLGGFTCTACKISSLIWKLQESFFVVSKVILETELTVVT